jgi:hypothetical protein
MHFYEVEYNDKDKSNVCLGLSNSKVFHELNHIECTFMVIFYSLSYNLLDICHVLIN